MYSIIKIQKISICLVDYIFGVYVFFFKGYQAEWFKTFELIYMNHVNIGEMYNTSTALYLSMTSSLVFHSIFMFSTNEEWPWGRGIQHNLEDKTNSHLMK